MTQKQLRAAITGLRKDLLHIGECIEVAKREARRCVEQAKIVVAGRKKRVHRKSA